ncbi:hypothetical protein BDK89_4078 [Ilumatobacter fluminis]|uniref:Uncharacterized protein n=1 Tax=Ilumatobacter fluminis TaxID=467091 RepID=A0A4R7I463_9ACTN|nr:hypothetical protein [Ilumatobacter fluminis]TDT18457.1 hypothetical protein BDK89_4078 [Ilumatobacter fluminis]
MTSDTNDDTPNLPSARDLDSDVQSTPAGTTDELEDEIDDTGAEVAPDTDD